MTTEKEVRKCLTVNIDQNILLFQFILFELVPDYSQQTMTKWLCHARGLCLHCLSTRFPAVWNDLQSALEDENIVRLQYASGLSMWLFELHICSQHL